MRKVCVGTAIIAKDAVKWRLSASTQTESSMHAVSVRHAI